ncbi:MAG: EamA family transporter, partial [Hyphomicrobiaceae bacterium]
TTLAAWMLMGERPGPRRVFAIVLGLAGLWLLLGGKSGWPVPQNLGDWFGLFSGMTWGTALALVRQQSDLNTWTVTASTFSVGLVVALVLLVVLPPTSEHVPTLANLKTVALPAFAFGSLVVWPSTCAMLWGARFLSAPTAALLTMSEIVAGVLSAAWLIGTSLDHIAMFGAIVILAAAIVDITAPEPVNAEHPA